MSVLTTKRMGRRSTTPTIPEDPMENSETRPCDESASRPRWPQRNEYDDGESAFFDASSGSDRDFHEAKKEEKEEDKIGKSETKAVGRLKIVVAFVLIASATLAAVSIHRYLSRSERAQFVSQFRDDSHKILEAAGSSLDKTLGLLDSVAVSYVSVADFTNQSWPFVTMPNFAVRMAKLLPLTDAIILNILPFVPNDLRREWEEYSVSQHDWVDQSMRIQDDWEGYFGPIVYGGTPSAVLHSDFADLLYNETRDFLPLWQNFPVLANTTFTYNWDWLSFTYPEAYLHCLKRHQTVISYPYMIEPAGTESAEDLAANAAETAVWADYFSNFIPPTENPVEPMGDLIYPIISSNIDKVQAIDADTYIPENHTAVALIVASMYWRDLIRGILPEGSNGIQVVFKLCAANFTYQINGPRADYVGVGDRHNAKYDHLGIHSPFQELGSFAIADSNSNLYSGAPLDNLYCNYSLHVYPSEDMEGRFTTRNPMLFTILSLVIFAFTSLVFYLYDATVEYRQRSVMRTAVRSTKIVSSLFPSAVRDRLYPVAEEVPVSKSLVASLLPETAKAKFASFVSDKTAVTDSVTSRSGSGLTAPIDDAVIAELYPETTVLFADIAGFTSWSSSRVPTQVFILLETLYASFDEIAKQRGVFKVETIGDCYLAVVGLPTPRKAHAVVMTRFAADCRNKMQELTMDLEKTLGPGTADLALRIGLNSGPTTAGVLRGEKSRFQLFGDTVNTAARMESNGEPNRIHVSQKTAELIKRAGKSHWLTQREEQVFAKGKGMMTTYWVEPKAGSTVSSSSYAMDSQILESPAPKAALDRLIGWNADVLSTLLKHVVAHREANDSALLAPAAAAVDTESHPLDEATDTLSTLQPNGYWDWSKPVGDVKLDPAVSKQLRDFVASIEDAYRAHPYNNFEHCSHVVMSTKKLLDRMTATIGQETRRTSASTGFHELLSDPLTHFGVVFAALAHDVDHPGVSNAQLVQEQHELARKYNGKSMAEQNSIDVAWGLLMKPQFAELRECIFPTQAEKEKFREVVVNVVLATDFFDQDLVAMRELRWQQTFGEKDFIVDDATDRKAASAILDLIIQVSDVSHTMQHFTVYKKWNTSLFTEAYDTYVDDRTPDDPTEGWFAGELAFFDNCTIPLATKLKACGVFPVSCDEFLDYANDNRLEWESKGHEIVQELADIGKVKLHEQTALLSASSAAFELDC